MLKFYFLLFIIFILILSFKSEEGFPTTIKHGNFFPYTIDKPFTEDGFYMMTVAWNIAEGNGIKYNLNRPTTGIQPLVTFIQAGIAGLVLMFGGDKIFFLRVIIIFSAILLFLFSLVTGGIVQKIIPGLYSQTITIFLVLFSFDLFEYFFNGLETGFYLLMISICISYSFRFLKTPDNKTAIIFGSLAGVTILTRVDFILPLFIYLLFLFISKRIEISKLIYISAAAALFLIPWLVYVYDVSGSIYPSSVSVQTELINPFSIKERTVRMLTAFFIHLTPWIFTHNFYISVAAALVYGVIFYYLVRKLNFLNVPEKFSFINLTRWGFSLLILCITYIVFSFALHFYIRYTTPFFVFILLVSICAVLFLLNKIPSSYKKLFYAAVVLFFFAQAFYYLFDGKLSNHLTLRISYIQKNFNNAERIGLFQSGVTGFFLDNVVNLDGKVDHVLHDYAVQNRFEDFLDSMKVNVIIEWKNDFNAFVSDKYFSKNWKMYEKDIGDGTTECFVRITPFESFP